MRVRNRAFTTALQLSVAVLATSFWATAVDAGALEAANKIRSQGCERRKPIASPLRRDANTQKIARAWSKGGRLREHIPQGYGQARFASLFVDGATADPQFERVLREQLCEELTEPEFTRIGVHTQGTNTWIVLSSAADAPLQKDASTIRRQALALVNEARSKARRCGMRNFQPAPPLRLNGLLNEAAARHANNMARHRKLQHEGFDGSTPAERVTAAGYRWRSTGENIAAGMNTAETVVAGWLDSPGHCANIMSAQFTEMGLAFAQDAGTNSGVYWAQVFATPR